MSDYGSAFEAAINKEMLYEVGGWWNINHPAVSQGLIDTQANRRAVGYVNDPDDAGGETKFGVAKNSNPDLDITNLTWDGAKAAYFLRYWLASKCDQMAPRVGALQFDSGINHGIGRAAMFLQRTAGVTPDGVIGPVTIAKLKQLNEKVLVNSICDQRALYYRTIVQNNPSQAKYLAGWMRRVEEMRAFCLSM